MRSVLGAKRDPAQNNYCRIAITCTTANLVGSLFGAYSHPPFSQLVLGFAEIRWSLHYVQPGPQEHFTGGVAVDILVVGFIHRNSFQN